MKIGNKKNHDWRRVTGISSRLSSVSLCLCGAFAFLAAATPAHAMHIADGILPLPWAGLWFAVAAPFLALGLKRLNLLAKDDLSVRPLVGLMAAVVFVISCMPIPIPVAGTCSHPCGTGIAAILLGPCVSVVITTAALLIQALFLAHGGLTTLGADVVSMGVAGSFAGWAVFRSLRGAGVGLGTAAFCAGICADWATYLTTAGELAAGIRGNEAFLPLFGRIALAFVPTQLPLGILEGAITAGMVTLLQRKRPELLVKIGVVKAGNREPGTGIGTVAGLVLIASLLTPHSSRAAEGGKWPGVDDTVVEKIAREHGREAKSILPLEGDLQLFAFLGAGAVGGFAAGYCWRMMSEGKGRKERE